MDKTIGQDTQITPHAAAAERGMVAPARQPVAGQDRGHLADNSPSSLSPEHGQEGRKIIAAEKAFDAAVYGFWNYGLQAGASVAAAMWFNHGGGKPYFEKSAEWLGKNVISKITNKTGAAAVAEARTPLIFTSLITVGNLFVLPMPYIERHKADYVSKINDWMNDRRTAKGDAPDAAELAEQQQAIAHIEQSPKQSTSSLWIGRALGLTCNYVATTLVTDPRNKKMEHAAANAVSGTLSFFNLPALAESETVRNVAKIAFLDYGYSMISSNVIYLYSHYLHPQEKKKEVEDTRPIHPSPMMVADSIQPTSRQLDGQMMGAAI